jgi:predicted anti-sigma-YlaC factor YlaD
MFSVDQVRSRESNAPLVLALIIRYCKTVAHLSIADMEKYALKKLSDVEMLRVEKHVARCPKCRDFLDDALCWEAAFHSPFTARVRKMISEKQKATKW